MAGTWLAAIRDATSVDRVEHVLRVCLQDALNREVHVDLGGTATHLLSAKEAAVPLIALAQAHPEARLASVVVEDLGERRVFTQARVRARKGGAELTYNSSALGARSRAVFMLSLTNGNSGYVNPIGTAAGALSVHEWGHVLDFTLDYLAGIRHDAPQHQMPHQLWARRSDRQPSLEQELDRASGVGPVRARVARFKDPRNPRGSPFKPKPLVYQSINFLEDKESWGLTYWKVKDQVTDYALKNRVELVSEAFTDVTLSAFPSQVNLAVHRRFMRALGHQPDHRVAGITDMVASVQAGFSEDEFFGGDYMTQAERDTWRGLAAVRGVADRDESGVIVYRRGSDRPSGPGSSPPTQGPTLPGRAPWRPPDKGLGRDLGLGKE